MPADRGFQSGARLAIASPFITLAGGYLVIAAFGMHRETGFGWRIIHVVAFAPVEWVWILPVATVCALLGARRFALGLMFGGAVLTVANSLAWIIGLSIGAQ